jgi:hypothetical protein
VAVLAGLLTGRGLQEVAVTATVIDRVQATGPAGWDPARSAGEQ